MPPLSDRAFRRPPDEHSEAIPKAAGIARIRNAVLLARIEDVVAVRTQGAFDQLIGAVLEITLELIVKEIEFRPHHLLEEILPGAYHEGRPPLPRMAVGTYAVLAADRRHEQPDRPHVGAERTETRFPAGGPLPMRPDGPSAAPARLRPPPAPPRCRPAGTAPPPWRASPSVARRRPSDTISIAMRGFDQGRPKPFALPWTQVLRPYLRFSVDAPLTLLHVRTSTAQPY